MKFKLLKPEVKLFDSDFELPVYDIEVEGDHSYVIGRDKIVVHNCSTRFQTGFGRPMTNTIIDCAKAGLPLIADGGISHYGDAAKAIALGACAIMSGSMFARCIDSPAETIVSHWVPDRKRWFGSASEENKGERKHVEGIVVEADTNSLTYEEMMEDWKQALQSSVSYAGGLNLKALKSVKWEYSQF